ncbi:MAG TPA: hypothetical protein VFM93_10705 [Candidatus Limnocylindria bacterium]|nr:hypothetical protein [Candidatus Limnocylindria bacterium]
MGAQRGEVVAITPANTVEVVAKDRAVALEDRLDRVRLATARPWSHQARQLVVVGFD